MYTVSYMENELRNRGLVTLRSNLGSQISCFYTVNNNRNKAIVLLDNDNLIYRHRNIYDQIREKLIAANTMCGEQWDILFVVFTPAKDDLLKGKNVLLVNQNTGQTYKWNINKSCSVQCDMVMQILEKQKKLSQRASLRGIEFVMPKSYKAVMTYIMAACCILVSILDTVHQVNLGYSKNIVAQGKYWRLFTYMFAHANIWHLFGNMGALLILGPVLERQVGSLKFTTVYILSGLFASYTSVCFGLNPGAVTVGASGAICGILGATLSMSLLTPKFYRRTDTGRLIASMAFILTTGVIRNLFGANIDNWCHLWGAIGGFLCMMIIQLIEKNQFLKWRIVWEKKGEI